MHYTQDSCRVNKRLVACVVGSESKYKGLEETIKNSTYLMIFVTKRYVDDEDAFGMCC